jgi:hypothetical protein
MADDEPTKAWSSVVPEFYYDLISRIPPGILLSLLLLHEFGVPDGVTVTGLLDANAGFWAVLAVFGIGAGYSVGLILHVPGGVLGWLYLGGPRDRLSNFQRKVFIQALANPAFRNFKHPVDEELPRADYRDFLLAMGDLVKLRNKHARAMVPKMGAEAMFFYNAAIALSVECLVHMIHSFYLRVPPHWIMLFFMSAAIPVFLLLGMARMKSLVNRQYSFLDMVLHESGAGGEKGHE